MVRIESSHAIIDKSNVSGDATMKSGNRGMGVTAR